MKHLMLFALLASFLGTTTSAFALETTTECPMMAQARKNAKANMEKNKNIKRRGVHGRKARTV